MREARRYEDLATHARSGGFAKVSAAAIQHWVKRGLLPSGEWIYWGFGRRSVVYPATTGRWLLALCSLRYEHRIRSLPLLGVALWLQSWPVASFTVRAGLTTLAELPLAFAARPNAADQDVWDVANVAVYERGFGASIVGPKPAKAVLALGLGDFAASMAGTIPANETDDGGLTAIGQLLGLDRAARDRLPGSDPWLPSDSPTALREAIDAVGTQSLRGILVAASDADLAAARDQALGFANAMLEAVGRFSDAGEPGFGGFDVMATYLRDPLGPALAVLAMLASPEGASAFATGLASGLAGPKNDLTDDQRTKSELLIIR